MVDTNTESTAREICSNCLRPVSCHRPWCHEVETHNPPKAGDVVNDPVEGSIVLQNVYLRSQAVSDGLLVDCTYGAYDQLNQKCGIRTDVWLTSTVFQRYVLVTDDSTSSENAEARYWDILTGLRRAVATNGEAHELLFQFLAAPKGPGMPPNEATGPLPHLREVTLKAVSHLGDRGEPCITFMLPSES